MANGSGNTETSQKHQQKTTFLKLLLFSHRIGVRKNRKVLCRYRLHRTGRCLEAESRHFRNRFRDIRCRPPSITQRWHNPFFATKMPQEWRPIVQVVNGNWEATRRIFPKGTPAVLIQSTLQLALFGSESRAYVNTSKRRHALQVSHICERTTSQSISETKLSLQKPGQQRRLASRRSWPNR